MGSLSQANLGVGCCLPSCPATGVSAYCLLTSPAGVAVKYCNERVCLCVCLSATNHMRDLYQIFVHIAYRHGSASGGVTQSQGEGAILRVFFPIDNAWCSIAFGTHTKTAEPIRMLFGLMTCVDLKGSGNFWGEM